MVGPLTIAWTCHVAATDYVNYLTCSLHGTLLGGKLTDCDILQHERVIHYVIKD